MEQKTFNRRIRLAAIAPAAAIAFALPQHAAAAGERAGSQTTSASATAPATADYRGLRASEAIGMSVRNEEGKNIGQIGDMIVDMNTGQVRYAILRFDPGIFQGEKLFAVPTTQLRMAPDRNDMVYRMDRERLERAAIERSEWNERYLNDPERLAKLDRAWVVPPAPGMRAARASDLIGMDVNSRSGESIGELEELVVNMATQKVHYAVLKFDPGWATPEKRVVFPLTAFNRAQGKDELVLDVDKSKVQAMKDFSERSYANLNDPVLVRDVDRYLVTVLPTLVVTPANRMGAPSSAWLFGHLDDDKNGSLDKQEVKDAADVDRNWSRFDKDGNGRISRDEFTSNYTVEPSEPGRK